LEFYLVLATPLSLRVTSADTSY